MGYFFFTQKSHAADLELASLTVITTPISPMLGEVIDLPVLTVTATLVAPTVYAGTPDTTVDLPILEVTATLVMPYLILDGGAFPWWYYQNILREGDQ